MLWRSERGATANIDQLLCKSEAGIKRHIGNYAKHHILKSTGDDFASYLNTEQNQQSVVNFQTIFTGTLNKYWTKYEK